ncbi:unnamed protein product [Aspergillus oryzae]|uniref:Unnamed protein product n=1 Tax=Aspergillus oryzae var. brunneus TaxID=332754 RepID=A0ABQ6LIM9_ASPOZ|nr:unnamed protein product [Aspergillus oryzae]GMF83587.1 unnamed protein product [Aspergillus oryzae]GMG55171.1 unnamed protein product [Aspergillus oryzae var. brunneus]
MKLLYTVALLALGSIAVAEDKTNETSTEATKATSQSSSNDGASKNLQSCHIPELKKGHILRASCFSDPATQQLVHSELDLNHCFGASLLKGELSAEAEYVLFLLNHSNILMSDIQWTFQPKVCEM